MARAKVFLACVALVASLNSTIEQATLGCLRNASISLLSSRRPLSRLLVLIIVGCKALDDYNMSLFNIVLWISKLVMFRMLPA